MRLESGNKPPTTVTFLGHCELYSAWNSSSPYWLEWRTGMSTTTPLNPLEALPEHEAWLRTSLLARLGSREEVEEVMQEVAVAAAHQANKAEPIDKVGPWLYRVAMRQMLQFRRKAGRRRKLIQNVAAVRPTVAVDSCSGDPIEFLISRERREAVRRGLAALAERDRQLLMLKYVEGLSYGEIATRLGVTASAVQSRLHRARAEMRKFLLSDNYES